MAISFDPPDVWRPFGAFSMMTIQGAGQIVYLKGQVALDREGRIVGRNDMRAQVRKTLENIQSVLASVGGDMTDIMSLTQYAVDIEAFMAVGDIRKQFFAEPFPVTTTAQVVRLYHPDLLIEIAATAEIPLDRFKRA